MALLHRLSHRASGFPWMVFPNRRATIIAASLLLLWPLVAGPAEPERRVIGIVTIPNPTYKSLSENIVSRFESEGYKCLRLEIPRDIIERLEPPGSANSTTSSAPGDAEGEDLATILDRIFKPMSEARPMLVIGLGETATVATVRTFTKVPVIFCMVPNGPDLVTRARKESSTSFVSGITSDIAPAEQLAWINKIHPQGRRVGILCSERTRQTVASFKSAAQAKRIDISAIEASKDKFPDALEALTRERCDSVLMIADAQIYNAANVRELLLWGLRNRKPIWAFSANIVKAGAVGAMYCEPEQIAQEAVDWSKQLIGKKKVPENPLKYPLQFHTAVNLRTAGMLGLQIPKDILDQVEVRYGEEK